MYTERHFTLPETIDEKSGLDWSRQANDFEAHLTTLEKERACASILSVFRQHPYLDSLWFLVRDGTDDEVQTARQFAQVLDVTPVFSNVADEDMWDESKALTAELVLSLTPRTVEFFEDLTIHRTQLLNSEGKARFSDLRAMRTWVELDLK